MSLLSKIIKKARSNIKAVSKSDAFKKIGTALAVVATGGLILPVVGGLASAVGLTTVGTAIAGVGAAVPIVGGVGGSLANTLGLGEAYNTFSSAVAATKTNQAGVSGNQAAAAQAGNIGQNAKQVGYAPGSNIGGSSMLWILVILLLFILALMFKPWRHLKLAAA